jgi:hypothetical protein
VFGCEFNDKDASKDFEYRVNYLKTLILSWPPTATYPMFKSRLEQGYHGYTGFEYEVYKTESITRPYRAELAFAYFEKPANQDCQMIREYKATFTHSAEEKSWWRLESIEEKSSEENSEWKASSGLDYIEFSLNNPKNNIRSEMKKCKEEREKSRKLMQKIERRVEKEKAAH